MQVVDGSSLACQEDRISAWCKIKGYTLKKIFSDKGLSGGSRENRVGLAEAIAFMERGDILCACDLSRLSRSMMDAIAILEEIKGRGGYLAVLNPDMDFSTPVGEMMFTMLVAFAQLERRQIGERIKTTMVYISEQNKLRGRSPFGWRFISKDKPLEPVPDQQETIDEIIAHYNRGRSSSTIARMLNEEGYGPILNLNKRVPVEDPKFTANTVDRILVDACVVDPKDKRKPLTHRYMDGKDGVSGEGK